MNLDRAEYLALSTAAPAAAAGTPAPLLAARGTWVRDGWGRLRRTVSTAARAWSGASSQPPMPPAVLRSLAFDCAATAIVIADARLRILVANAAYARMVGVPPEQLTGTRLPTALPEGTTPDAVPGGTDGLTREGRVGTSWMNLRAVTDGNGHVHCHVATFTDLRALEAEQETLRRWAQHDPLTDLPNRRLFGVELERCVARARRHGRRCGVLFLDLDRFKQINDTLGHDAGDALLQEVARRLQQAVRAEDLVARWGGDEFVVVLDDLRDARAAAAMATVLQHEIARPVEMSGEVLVVSASIGIAMFPDDAGSADALLRGADMAMYAAKRAGPGRCAGCEPQAAVPGASQSLGTKIQSST